MKAPYCFDGESHKGGNDVIRTTGTPSDSICGTECYVYGEGPSQTLRVVSQTRPSTRLGL